jgi:hypothetical protein
MRTTISLRFLGAASLALATATACSSNSAIPPQLGATAPASGLRSVTPPLSLNAGPAKKKQKPLLYVADGQNNLIDVFEQTTKSSPKLKYTITKGIDFPDGITTNEAGNLFVTNDGNNSLTIYKAGEKSPIITITTGMNDPVDVAVDAHGNIYVANNPSNSSDYINLYPAGTTSPSYTWYPPQSSGLEITSLALLAPKENGESGIYAPYYTTNSYGSSAGGSILYCHYASTECVEETNTYSFTQPGGIAISSSLYPSGELDFMAADQGADMIDSYQMYGLGEQFEFSEGGAPDFLAFNSTRTALFVSNEMNSVDEYAYPRMNLINSYHGPTTGGEQFLGVAVSPAGTYF